MTDNPIDTATSRAIRADRFQQVLYSTRKILEVTESELDAVTDTLKETRDQLRDAAYKQHMAENREAMFRKDVDRLQVVIDTHEKEDAQAIELLRKARQTIGINPDGARNLVDQATTILNPPQADDAAAPF